MAEPVSGRLRSRRWRGLGPSHLRQSVALGLHAVEGTALIIAVYLLINLAASILLDRYNRRAAILER